MGNAGGLRGVDKLHQPDQINVFAPVLNIRAAAGLRGLRLTWLPQAIPRRDARVRGIENAYRRRVILRRPIRNAVGLRRHVVWNVRVQGNDVIRDVEKRA